MGIQKRREIMEYKVFEVVADDDGERITFELIPVQDFPLTRTDIGAIEMALEIADYTFLPAPDCTYLVTKKDSVNPDEIDASGCILRHKKGGVIVID